MTYDQVVAGISGLQVFYRMLESNGATSLADSSGNGHSMPMVGSTVFSSASTPAAIGGQAMVCNGSQVGGIGSPGAWWSALTALSAMAWFKTTSTGNVAFWAGDQTIYAPGSNYRKFNFYLGTGTLIQMSFTNLGGYPYAQAAGPYNDGNWHCAVTTRAAAPGVDAQKLYIDGVLVAKQSSSGAWSGVMADLTLGQVQTGYNFVGSLGPMALWNRELTPQEVSTLFTSASAPAAPPPTYTPVTGVTPSASSSTPTAPASNLFGGTSGYWEAAAPATVQAPITVTAALPSGQAKQVDQYGLTARSDRPDKAPASWTFEGSMDGVTWTVIDSQTGQAFSAAQTKQYTTGQHGTYAYYRLQVTAGGVTTEAPSFDEWLLATTAPATPGVVVGSSTFSAPIKLFGKVYAAGDLIPAFPDRLLRSLSKRGYITPAGTLTVKRAVKVDGTAYAPGVTWSATVIPKTAKKLLRGRFIGK